MYCIDINTLVDTFANVAVAILALVAIIQTRIAIKQTKRDSFIHLVLTMYAECRKIIDTAWMDGCTTNTVGLECFKVAYERAFRACLSKNIDKSKPLTEQVEEDVIPSKQQVEQKFQEIVNDICPNIGTYITSVISILSMIDNNKLLDKESKIQCTSYIKAQTTQYEKLWLYYYNELKKENADLLRKYHIIDGTLKNKTFAIAEENTNN